ncbi:tryptophan halogenase family protein [Colwelliaceae bacterium MEBiC 14330]
MNNIKELKNIVIAGGGTAGWLTANHLAKKLIKVGNDITITLVESDNIPTVGVGEGTVPLMRQTLQSLGISETEFIVECDATFKQGIKFVDWVNNPIKCKPSYYHHVFDNPTMSNLDLTSYWLKSLRESGLSYVDAISIQGKVCDSGLAPKLITTAEYQGVTPYAYHLDASKFTALLTKHAVSKLGVKHIKADIADVTLAQDGSIESLVTSGDKIIAADFFVDCTGFQSLLLGEALKVPFIDKSDVLFADHAVAIQVPYDEEDTPIPSFTTSTALNAGWIWDIGLKNRRGIGHVYSSSHTTHEQAEQDLRDYIGSSAENISSRVIPMKVGYREKFWQKNCVAIGLSQGFVEPLEATGLLVFDTTAKMLAEQFPSNNIESALIAEQFNQRVSNSWINIVDFIKAHYCLSKRNDTDFWCDNRLEASIPNSLKDRLARWKYQPPSHYDFANKFSVFNLENYRYILYGMEFEDESELFLNRLDNDKVADKVFKNIAEKTDKALSKLPKNRELIDKIYKYGLQRI